jgi:hypothetical protein
MFRVSRATSEYPSLFFNRRVLEEALDSTNPLLKRVKFLAKPFIMTNTAYPVGPFPAERMDRAGAGNHLADLQSAARNELFFARCALAEFEIRNERFARCMNVTTE